MAFETIRSVITELDDVRLLIKWLLETAFERVAPYKYMFVDVPYLIIGYSMVVSLRYPIVEMPIRF